MNEVLAHARAAADRGDLDEAVRGLVEANRSARRPVFEREILDLRHRAFHSHAPSGPSSWPEPVPDRWPAETGIPEVHADELDAATVASALQHHGALLVRGLIPEDRAASLRDAIDDAFAGAERFREDQTVSADAEFRPFRADDRYEFGGWERAFANFGAGVLGVDSPRAMFLMVEALEAAGARPVITDYFGERPAFSVKKTTLRRTEPDALAGWHQDGAFLGIDTRALNIWTALSPCGVDAAGLDVFAQRFDHLVPTGGPDIYDWSVSDETASRYDQSRIERPEFGTGDALLFDHMTLHRTGIDPTMTETRYAIEMWFFAPSAYPTEQIPILF